MTCGREGYRGEHLSQIFTSQVNLMAVTTSAGTTYMLDSFRSYLVDDEVTSGTIGTRRM